MNQHPTETHLPDAALWHAYAEGRSDERAELIAEDQRNKHRPPVTLTGERQSPVTLGGVEMNCVFEFYPAEPMVRWGDFPYPGAPAFCELRQCFVESTDIMELLDDSLVTRIEELLLEQTEEF